PLAPSPRVVQGRVVRRTTATGLGARPAQPTTHSASAVQLIKCFMGGPCPDGRTLLGLRAPKESCTPAKMIFCTAEWYSRHNTSNLVWRRIGCKRSLGGPGAWVTMAFPKLNGTCPAKAKLTDLYRTKNSAFSSRRER